MDGSPHVTDMSWGRLGHPSVSLKVGQEVEVVVLDINGDKERVSLGLKQITEEPDWERDRRPFPRWDSGAKRKITNLVPYGAFVEIEEGVEGLIWILGLPGRSVSQQDVTERVKQLRLPRRILRRT
jgi:small subunit ribosomal protein S1